MPGPNQVTLDPYTPQSTLLAQILAAQHRNPVQSVGQGFADVLGDVGSAYFEKQARLRDQQKLSDQAQALAQAMGVAGNTGMTNGQAAVQGLPYTPAQPAFPNGPPQVPGAGGDPHAPAPVAQDSGINSTLSPQARGLAALTQLTNANPQMAAQYGPQVMELAKQVTPKITYQDTGGQLTPFDEFGNVQQGVKPIAIGMSPGQKAQIDLQNAQLEESKREHNITAQQGRYKIGKDAFGNETVFDTAVGKYVDPSQLGATGQGRQLDPDSIQATAQQIYEYRKKPLSAFVLKTPYGQMIQEQINNLDAQGQAQGNAPYNEQYYATSQKARNDFATGKQGDTVKSANVWTHHLLMLKGLGEALDNGDSQTVNRITQLFQNEFNDPKLSSYQAIAPLVGEEGAKFIMGGKSTGAERQEFMQPLIAAKNTTSRNAAINKLIGAAGAQLRGLKKQYESSVRAKDFDSMLFPEVSQMLGADAPSSSGITTQAAQPQGTTAAAPAVRVYNPKTGRLE